MIVKKKPQMPSYNSASKDKGPPGILQGELEKLCPLLFVEIISWSYPPQAYRYTGNKTETFPC